MAIFLSANILGILTLIYTSKVIDTMSLFGFKRMVGMKQENGLKSESIRKIMRQKRLTEKHSRVGGPTLH